MNGIDEEDSNFTMFSNILEFKETRKITFGNIDHEELCNRMTKNLERYKQVHKHSHKKNGDKKLSTSDDETISSDCSSGCLN
jgi:hypothetical protein